MSQHNERAFDARIAVQGSAPVWAVCLPENRTDPIVASAWLVSESVQLGDCRCTMAQGREMQLHMQRWRDPKTGVRQVKSRSRRHSFCSALFGLLPWRDVPTIARSCASQSLGDGGSPGQTPHCSLSPLLSGRCCRSLPCLRTAMSICCHGRTGEGWSCTPVGGYIVAADSGQSRGRVSRAAIRVFDMDACL
jgi:hypothetical protein